MKHFFTLCVIGILAGSCMSEKDAKPGNATTFVHYFSGGYNDQAVTVEETADGGYILLTNSKIQVSEATAPIYRIKLIKTDAFGNPVWQSILNDSTKSYRSTDLDLIPGGGYVITGEDIKPDTSAYTLVMTVDENGKSTGKTISKRGPGKKSSISGQAVTVNAVGNYIVLSLSGNANMHLTEFIKGDTTAKWTTAYAAGKTTLASEVFIDNAGKYLWSGTVTKTDATGIRMVKTAANAVNTDFDLTILNPGFSETASDFTRYGYGYAVIGSTNQKRDDKGNVIGVADFDILFKRLGSDGTVLSSKSFPLGSKDNSNDLGNAISSTQDGGLILLGSVNSVSINGNGDDDYILIKVDAFGEEVWRQNFGSRYKDAGVAVKQTSDGGYLVLGTTTQGQLDIVMLAKTDKDGKIE